MIDKNDSNDSLKTNSKFPQGEDLGLEQDIEMAQEQGKQKSEKRKDNIGKLGTWFGSSKNAPTNISGMLILTLIAFGIIFTIVAKEFANIVKVWDIVTPMITLALGYIFGKQQQ